MYNGVVILLPDVDMGTGQYKVYRSQALCPLFGDNVRLETILKVLIESESERNMVFLNNKNFMEKYFAFFGSDSVRQMKNEIENLML
jgi:hypothetical protein